MSPRQIRRAATTIGSVSTTANTASNPKQHCESHAITQLVERRKHPPCCRHTNEPLMGGLIKKGHHRRTTMVTSKPFVTRTKSTYVVSSQLARVIQ